MLSNLRPIWKYLAAIPAFLVASGCCNLCHNQCEPACQPECESCQSGCGCGCGSCCGWLMGLFHRKSLAIPQVLPLGKTVEAWYQVMETNAEASDFILHQRDFVGETTQLTPDGKDHLMEIAARMRANPFPVVVELRRLGHDAITVAETGLANQQMSDEEVLELPRHGECLTREQGTGQHEETPPKMRANERREYSHRARAGHLSRRTDVTCLIWKKSSDIGRHGGLRRSRVGAFQTQR